MPKSNQEQKEHLARINRNNMNQFIVTAGLKEQIEEQMARREQFAVSLRKTKR